MIEMMFGSGSPMWTPMQSSGIAYQPVGLGSRPLGATVFSSPVGGGIAPGSTGASGLSMAGSLSPTTYGYGGAATLSAPQNLAGPGLAVAYPFALNPQGASLADPTGVVTASSLLGAVAIRRGQPQGPTNDLEVEEFIYDALELLPGAADVEIRCESGRVTLSGSVPHKRTKRDAGEIAWAIPALQDVQNNLSITSRRRARTLGREAETPAASSGRKQG